MPVHGIKLDLEFAGLAVSAALISLFMTGQIISNVLFTALISILFFLIGIHLDVSEIRKCGHYRKELALGGVMIYLLAPLLAFGISTLVPGSLGDAFIAIGFSAAAIGSPVVFSNVGKGEGNLALLIGTLSLLTGFLIIPLLLFGMSIDLPIGKFAVNNLLFAGLPLAVGVVAQRFHNFLFDDFRHHFSKLALWLLILVMAVQFQLIIQSRGLSFLLELGRGVVLIGGFVAVSYFGSYFISKKTGVMERNARTIGFVTGSKAIAIALFIASQFGGEVVAYVSVYYFVRQAVMGTIAEYYSSGQLPLMNRLKSVFPVTQ